MLKTCLAGVFRGSIGIGIYFLIALTSVSVSARTLLESENTLYNLNLIGFAHLDLAEFDDAPPATSGITLDEGFQEARLALHLSSRLGQRFSAFLEAEVTADEDDVGLEVERVIVKYDIDNVSQFSVGRYHAPIGYWNQHYHHGRWLQISKNRPVQSEFGLGFLPGHFWGAMYERRFALKTATIELDLGIGERTESFLIPDFAGPVTISGEEAVMAQINVTPASNTNLTFGGSLWVGDLEGPGNLSIEEQVLTAHVNYKMGLGEFVGEVSAVKHDFSDARGSFDSYGGYLQYSYHLQQWAGRMQPFVRLDYPNIDSEDLIFSSLQSHDRQTLGMRIEVSERSAIKVEARHDKYPDTGQSVNSLHGQFATYF